MTFEQYVKVAEHNARKGDQRRGQAYWNTLHSIRRDLSVKYHQTDLDPFYRDSILPDFLVAIMNEW